MLAFLGNFQDPHFPFGYRGDQSTLLEDQHLSLHAQIDFLSWRKPPLPILIKIVHFNIVPSRLIYGLSPESLFVLDVSDELDRQEELSQELVICIHLVHTQSPLLNDALSFDIVYNQSTSAIATNSKILSIIAPIEGSAPRVKGEILRSNLDSMCEVPDPEFPVTRCRGEEARVL